MQPSQRYIPPHLKPARPLRTRAGFTMIEMLLAMSLSTVLMVAVLGLTGSIKHVPSDAPSHLAEHERRLTEHIQQDLIHAHAIEQVDNTLTIYTYRALTPKTSAPSHRPVVVRYRIAESAGRPWLVRDQHHLNPENPRKDAWALRTTMIPGVSHVEWTLADHLRPEGDHIDSNEAEPNSRQQTDQDEKDNLIYRHDFPAQIQAAFFANEEASEAAKTLSFWTGVISAPIHTSEDLNQGDDS